MGSWGGQRREHLRGWGDQLLLICGKRGGGSPLRGAEAGACVEDVLATSHTSCRALGADTRVRAPGPGTQDAGVPSGIVFLVSVWMACVFEAQF